MSVSEQTWDLSGKVRLITGDGDGIYSVCGAKEQMESMALSEHTEGLQLSGKVCLITGAGKCLQVLEV